METVEATALRFAVYSDADLDRVTVTVLDEARQSGPSREYSVTNDAGARNGGELFAFWVERTAQSKSDHAIVRFEGFRVDDSKTELVLRQTVRGDFADSQTGNVRIWLARSCVGQAGREKCDEGLECQVRTGECMPELEVFTGSANAADAPTTSWRPDGYVGCGDPGPASPQQDGVCPAWCRAADDLDCPASPMRACQANARGQLCRYARCVDDLCAEPELVGEREVLGAGTLLGTYLRRADIQVEAVVSIGARFMGPGGVVRLYLVDDDAGAPGAVLVSELVEVRTDPADPEAVYNGLAHFDIPKGVVPAGSTFWLGVEQLEKGSLIGFSDEPTLSKQVQFSPGVRPMAGERFSITPMDYEGGTGVSPVVYAGYFAKTSD